MAAQSNLIAFDGATTPVSHTFTGVGVKEVDGEDIANYREILASLPIIAQATVKTTSRKLKSGTYRTGFTVSVPIMEAVGSQNAAGYTAPPKVAHIVAFQCMMFASERATTAERRMVKQIATNLLSNVTTTVPAVSAGMAAELIDSNVVPS